MFTAALGYGAKSESKIFIFEFDGLKGFYNDIIKGDNKCNLNDLSRLDNEKVLEDKLKQYYFICTGDYEIEGKDEFLGVPDVEYSHRKSKLLSNDAKYHCLVIDGDMSDNDSEPLCDAQYVHDVLVRLGYNHFVYTSYSNGKDGKNKWRAVVECEVSRCDLVNATRSLWEWMNSAGVNVKFASENKDTVRIWFFGKSWTDGYADYGWFEGLPFMWKDSESAGESSSAGSGSEHDEESLDEFEYKMLHWSISTDRHESLLKFALGLIKDTQCNRAMVIKLVQIAMKLTPVGSRDSRWDEEYRDISRSVDGAINRIKGEIEEDSKVDLSGIRMERIVNSLPMPPGLLGELCMDSFNMQHFQHKEIALASALALVAGICGRKFNVDTHGLNLYITLVADTGMGKDAIKRFINTTLSRINKLGKGSSFIGASDCTGPKPLAASMECARSKICVFEEAGLMMASQVGAKQDLQKFLLSSYTSSSWDGICGGTMYSDDKNSIPIMHGLALSIISESTPDVLFRALGTSGSMMNGHLPRQTIFRVMNDKPPINRNRITEISSKLRLRLSKLVDKCSEIQAKDILEYDDVWHFDMKNIQENFFDYCDECRLVGQENKGTPKGAMSTRAAVKALKYAAIATVINYEHELVIQKPEWEWGKSLATYELNGVSDFFSGTSFDNVMDDVAKRVIGPSIYKLVELKMGADGQIALNRHELDKGYIPFSKLYRDNRNNKQIQYDDRLSHNECMRKVIRYMCDDVGYISRVHNPMDMRGRPYRCDVFTVTPFFLELFK